jgi:putative DNA primase/helicase
MRGALTTCRRSADDGEVDFPEPPDSCGIDPELIAACAAEPLNDTGNGQRLLKYFGNRILNVREVSSKQDPGWHHWTGTHCCGEGGADAAMLLAQETAARIQLEADYIGILPKECDAIEAADGAEVALERPSPSNAPRARATKACRRSSALSG